MSQLCDSTLVMSMVRNKKLVAKAHLQIPAGIRDLFDDPPLLASEDPQAYRRLVWAIVDEVKPSNPFEWSWVKDIVSHEWEIRRLRVFKHHIIERACNARADKNAMESYRQVRERKPSTSEKVAAIRAFAQGEMDLTGVNILSNPQNDLEITANIPPLLPQYNMHVYAYEMERYAKRHNLEVIQPDWSATRAVDAYQKWLKVPADPSPLDVCVDPEKLRQLTPKLDTEADFAQAFVDSIEVHEKLDRLMASHEHRRDRALREIELHREIRARRRREAGDNDPPALVAAE